MGSYIRPDSGKWFGKHVPTATVMHAMGKNGMLSTQSMPRRELRVGSSVELCKGG
jgi:hypothetical protein